MERGPQTQTEGGGGGGEDHGSKEHISSTYVLGPGGGVYGGGCMSGQEEVWVFKRGR